LVFAATMGFLWRGVAPLVTGWIGETFGLTWLAMLGGVVLGLAAGLVQGATPGGAAVRRCRSARVEHQPPRRPDA